MSYVMAAMAAATMLQGSANAAEKRKVDSAGIRYSPWTKIKDLPYTPDEEAKTALQGYTGIKGQMQAQKTSDVQDAYLQSLTDKNNGGGPTTPGGSFMNDPVYHGGGAAGASAENPVRGYDPDQAMVDSYKQNAGTNGGVNHYNQDPYSFTRQMLQRRAK